MNHIVFGCVAILIACACVSLSAVAQEDARFTAVHDKDHPWQFEPKFADRAAWEDRAESLRHQAMVAQGLWPMPAKTPLNPVIHGAIDRDTYTIEKVFFASLPGHYVSGNLYRPKGKSGKLPAVLAPYGHWPEGRFWWRDDAGVQKELKSGAETDANTARSPLQANAVQLARMGCIVFQYDMVGYCDSTKLPHREGFLDAEALLRLQSFMGLQTWNSIRAMDFVLSLPDVDRERIAVTGSSSGGTQTIALNAVDPCAAVAFPMVMVSMAMQGGCVCENAPLYRVQTNNVELASLFAPKPEGMAAANDWTINFMKLGLPEMKAIWGLYNAQDCVDGAHVDFGHNHNLPSRLLQYAFLNKHLQLGLPEPIKEQPFELTPPKELSVYDAQHPRPADEVDAAGVRKWMTEQAEKAMNAMSREQRAETLRVALGAMVVDHKPSAGEREYVGEPPRFSDEGGTWNGAIARKGSGERVPCKIIQPANWNKKTVLWAHPDGCKSLTSEAPAAKKLLDRGFAILAIDLIFSGDFKPAPKPGPTAQRQRGNPNPPYAAYAIGYERSVIANRVHDLLTAFGCAQLIAYDATGDGSVNVIAFGDAGVPAMLACAVAGHHVSRAAIDLNQFDFDQIKSDSDPMLLPGALKYGGIYSLATLCDSGQILLCNARQGGQIEAAKAKKNLTFESSSRDASAMADWVLDTKP